MKKLILTLFALLLVGTAQSQEKNMKIRLTFNNKTVIIAMENNSAVRQVLSFLPADFQFEDFAGEEKVANLPSEISLADAPRGMKALAGRMFIYAPWGNIGIFYKDHGHSLDKNLIALGTVESGLEHLVSAKGGFAGRMEIIK